MKLVRFGEPGSERPGVWLEKTGEAPVILDVRASVFDISDYDAHFFATGGLQRLNALLEEKRRTIVPAAGVRLGPPVARPGKIMCLGANYADHAAEFGADVPTEPIVFAKASTAVTGPFDPIELPAGADTVDAEVELGVVIGQMARQVASDDAMHFVAGYTVVNDVTDRVTQRAAGQWFRGKGCDTFCPMGPFLVTPDEIPDPANLRLYSALNEDLLQDGCTKDMIFGPARIIEVLSAAITLEPGDVIATGTPAGVGSAHEPPRVLKPGDTVEVGVEGVGVQISPVVRRG
jgi:2-keto-4-pentenoate hydratase/2-oxohepta-3-ene-1,7-dioic acid hydratase in catechol pathway